jgi:hypothetical protein
VAQALSRSDKVKASGRARRRGAPLARAELAAEERIAQARGRAGDFVGQVTGEARRVRNEDVRGEVCSDWRRPTGGGGCRGAPRVKVKKNKLIIK